MVGVFVILNYARLNIYKVYKTSATGSWRLHGYYMLATS